MTLMAIPLITDPEPNPIRFDRDGVARIAGTRVTLDTLIIAFHQGATPEEMAQQYPVLRLPDIYTVIAYYLHHRDEVDAYLEQRQRDSLAVRQENEARFDPTGIRERLMARRNSQE